MNKKFDLRNSLDRLLPPGMTSSRIVGTFAAQAAFGAFLYLFALVEFTEDVQNVLRNISRGYYEEYPLSYYPFLEHNIPSIHSYLKITMTVFALYALLQLAYAVTNYMYYHRESKSVYVMKRVRDKWEIHRACWTVPLICALMMLLLLAILYGIFCLLYFHFTPEGHIPEQTIAFFWRYVP